MANEAMTFMVEGAELLFKNFAGKEGKYNREGDRNFSVVLEPEMAERMLADGWNVRYLKPQEEGDESTPCIQVAVSYKIRPPRIVMMTSRARTPLGEDSVEVLDWANIASADLIARSSFWTNSGNSGYKAYLQSLYVTIEEDALERKWAVEEVPAE